MHNLTFADNGDATAICDDCGKILYFEVEVRIPGGAVAFLWHGDAVDSLPRVRRQRACRCERESTADLELEVEFAYEEPLRRTRWV